MWSLALAGMALWACTADGGAADETPGTGPPPGTEREWAELKQEIRSRFPQVPQLSTAAYAQSRGGADAPLLVDVRPAAEHDLGWIPGSIHVPAGEGFVAGFDAVAKDRHIVLYCSVGWRSSEAAIELRAAGFSRVQNLEGSLFEWANAGRPMVDARGAVQRVHPFDSHWARLLAPAHRAPLPAPR